MTVIDEYIIDKDCSKKHLTFFYNAKIYENIFNFCLKHEN